MNWSFAIATVRGIAIRVHFTFAFVVALFAFQFGRMHGAAGALFGIALVNALFVCIALHELGHSLVARYFGVPVKEIVLLPIGGVARLTREPKKPWHELLIAIAGPLVNVVIATLLFVVALVFIGRESLLGGELGQAVLKPSGEALVLLLLAGNLGIALFNMVPALPMDGGRVFRALLSMFIGKVRATAIAVGVGQVLAVGIAIIGLLASDPIVVVIGGFVFFSAAQERFMSRAAPALRELRAADVCNPHALALGPGNTIAEAVQLLVRTPQPHFVVLFGEQLVGVVARDALLRAMTTLGPGAHVAAVMKRDVPTVADDTPLDEVRARLIEAGDRAVVVMGSAGFVGLIGMEDVARVATLAPYLQTADRLGQREAV